MVCAPHDVYETWPKFLRETYIGTRILIAPLHGPLFQRILGNPLSRNICWNRKALGYLRTRLNLGSEGSLGFTAWDSFGASFLNPTVQTPACVFGTHGFGYFGKFQKGPST